MQSSASHSGKGSVGAVVARNRRPDKSSAAAQAFFENFMDTLW
jgi:hypothetical protein